MAQNPYKITVNSFSFKSDPALVYMKYVHIEASVRRVIRTVPISL